MDVAKWNGYKSKMDFYAFDEAEAGIPLNWEGTYLPGSYHLESIHLQ